jgi:hypothetical protein
MGENFIIEEVISDLVDANKSLVSPLMKLQYFAKRTKNEELLQLVLAELNGYKNRKSVPDYRTAAAIINVDIQFDDVKHPNLEIPVEMLPEDRRDAFRRFILTEPVSVLEQMAVTKESAKDFSQYLYLNLPISTVHLFQDAASKLYKNPYYRAVVFAARLLANRNLITRALTAIRSRLLSFCMEIGDTFGYNIAIDSFNKAQSVNNEKIIHLMSTVINNQGDGNVISSGSNAHIYATINIAKGDKEQLNKKLANLGIDKADIQEINEIVDEEATSCADNQLGNKAIDWILKVSGKALKGIGSIAKEVTSAMLAHLLMQYFGIPPVA